MDIHGLSALTAYSYKSALAQTGDGGQALAQAFAASQAQVAQAGTLFSSPNTAGSTATLAVASTQAALATLSYTTANATGHGASAVQTLLGSLNGGGSALLPTPDSLPLSTSLLSARSMAALARYAYDQSQNASALATQGIAAGQQTLLASGWNLLV